MEPNFDYYQTFSIEDFVNDPFFRDWVLRPDSDRDEYWEAWLAVYPDKRQTLAHSRKLLLDLGVPHYNLSDASVKNLWQSIQKEVKPKSTLARNFRLWYVAASLLVLIGLSFIFYTSRPTLLTFKTAFGETRELILPDQSVVILNSNSTIKYEANWDEQAAREIYVDGEAFFSVVHLEDGQPFKVFTGKGVAVEVLGTEFNVYNRAANTQIVLSSGAITLTFPSNEKERKILMQPNQMVEFKENKFRKKEVNAANYVSWTNKILNLEETSLEDMIQKARDNYGITVSVTDTALLDQTASGSMPITDAEAFMNQISKIFNVEITESNNIYIIKN